MYAKNFSIYSIKQYIFSISIFQNTLSKTVFFKKMSDFYNLEQKSTETIFDYIDRFHETIITNQESTDKKSLFWTEKCFIIAFINGLYNDKVKSKMNKWYEENPSKILYNAVFKADDYQNTEDGTEDTIDEIDVDKSGKEDDIDELNTISPPKEDMVRVNRKLDFTSFDNEKKPKKRLRPHEIDRKLNLTSVTKEANINDYTIEYLCPYKDATYKCSNKIFRNPEYAKKHLSNYHKIARKFQKPLIARIAYKKIGGSSPVTV